MACPVVIGVGRKLYPVAQIRGIVQQVVILFWQGRLPARTLGLLYLWSIPSVVRIGAVSTGE
jgi:hypothetical protein